MAKAGYFDTNDPSSLADVLAKAFQNPEPALPRNLLPDLDIRVAAFASGFVATVRRATQGYHSVSTIASEIAGDCRDHDAQICASYERYY